MLRRGSSLLLRHFARRGAASDAPAALAAASSSVLYSTRAAGCTCRTSSALGSSAERRGDRYSLGAGAAAIGARAFRSSASPLHAAAAFTMPSPTQLDAVMRVETLVDRTADEIEDIWMAYHGGDPAAAATQQQAASSSGGSGEDDGSASAAAAAPAPPPAGEHCVGTVLSAEEYKVLSARAKASPMFVLPLRKTVVRRREGQREGGAGGADASSSSSSADHPPAYLTLLLQWHLPLLLVTTVDEYHRLGPGAPPHLVATFYPQLADSKGIVLARGDLTASRGGAGGAVTSRAEARTVLELARAFYTDGDMHRLAYAFNHDQQNFEFGELLRALGLEGAAPVEADGAAATTGT